MSRWVTGFVIPDVADVHVLFGRVLSLATQLEAATRGSPLAAGAASTLVELRRAYVDFNDGLDFAAKQAAQEATQGIKQRLQATLVRSDTGGKPMHLRNAIRAAPLSVGALGTGAVGIGDVALLDQAVNAWSPGYGPYWRAQEYGTGQGEVPSQLGRQLFGYFALAGGGDPTPPQAQYAGGGGPHPIFLPAGNASGKRGGRGGIGTIGTEIRPKHFIRLGKDAAAVAWRARIDAVQQQALDRLAAIGAP